MSDDGAIPLVSRYTCVSYPYFQLTFHKKTTAAQAHGGFG